MFLAEIPMRQAISGPDFEEWNNAMASEIKSIIQNDTWEIVDRPEKEHVIGSRIVLRNKMNADGTLERQKARLVAQGFTQKPGVHFHETFAPVARMSSIRILISMAARLNMKIHQFDVTCAYLNGDLEETIHMAPPRRLPEILRHISETDGDSDVGRRAQRFLRELQSGDKVFRLKKALYGLKQAGKQWHIKLDGVLKKLGAKPTSADPCFYYVGDGGDLTLISVYVDDIIVASKKSENIDKIERQLSEEFQVKSLGAAKYCLGLEFTRGKNDIVVTQKGYISEIVDRFGMAECNPVSTPMDPESKLKKPEGDRSLEDVHLPYRELVGALTYLANATRPDISFTASYLSQFNNCYTKVHWTAAKRVLRYLKGTKDLDLVYCRGNDPVRGYVDADWGSCPNDRRSYTGFAFILNGSPITWDARKQRTVALSSMEAEYMALAEAAKESIYLQGLLGELKVSPSGIIVSNDNLSALKLAENSTFHGRSKHIDMRYHFIRDALKMKQLTVQHVSTDRMPADVLTKGLSKSRHISCVKMMGLGTHC